MGEAGAGEEGRGSGRQGLTVPEADLKLLLLDALDVAAEEAGEHLAHHPLEHGGGGGGAPYGARAPM